MSGSNQEIEKVPKLKTPNYAIPKEKKKKSSGFLIAKWVFFLKFCFAQNFVQAHN